MRKVLCVAICLLMATILWGCNFAPNLDDSEKDNKMEYYDPAKADYNLTLFPISVPQSDSDPREAKVLILSDNHYRSFSGVAGYSDEERQEKMVQMLIDAADDNRYDCVILNGDLANQNYALQKGLDVNYVQELHDNYLYLLDQAGIHWYALNASHDSSYGEEFEAIFGYENNYVILAGTMAFICVDTYGGERREDTFETMSSDIPADFVEEVEKLLRHDYVESAFMVCHWPNGGENFLRLLGHEKVLGTLAGHSHYNWVMSYGGKPLAQTGHFSRAFTKMLTWGLGFSEFHPLNDSIVGTTTDEDGKENQKDYSGTGSPWQYRIVEQAGAKIESYMVFPEMEYQAFSSDGNFFPAFTQPYTEARPSFLGEDVPVDRSYILFRDGE